MEPGNERTWPRQEWRRARIKGSDDGGAKKGGGESVLHGSRERRTSPRLDSGQRQHPFHKCR